MNAISEHKIKCTNGYKYISQAIDLENQNVQTEADMNRAIRLYQMGYRELKYALDMKVEDQAIRDKNSRIRINMNLAQERISYLQEQLQNKRKSTTRVSSAKHSKQHSNHSESNSEIATNILNQVLIDSAPIKWTDVIGLESAKQALIEIVVYPSLRPELFTGLRAPARGVLLFGPPGTGKTLIAKAVAHESNAKFFPISCSSLTSKNYGDSEKIVKTLFQIARKMQPSVIFIDEVDSILKERSESEHEASRRIKTEFLLQFDGIGTSSEERVLVLAATNRPFDLDEAALRRFVKRIYIPLPEPNTRRALLEHLLCKHKHSLGEKDFTKLIAMTDGYSGSDISALAREASLGPIRELGSKLITVPERNINAISLKHFEDALMIIRRSVSKASLDQYEKFSREYGTNGA